MDFAWFFLWPIGGKTQRWCHHPFPFYMKQTDSMLPWVCSVTVSNRSQKISNVVRTCVIHLVVPHLPFILFLSHFDVICDLLLDRYTCKMESFVKLILSNEFLVTDDFHLWSRFSNLINWLSSILDLQCKQKELLRIHRLSHSINFLTQEKVNSPTKMDLSMRDLSTNTEDMVKENGS